MPIVILMLPYFSTVNVLEKQEKLLFYFSFKLLPITVFHILTKFSIHFTPGNITIGLLSIYIILCEEIAKCADIFNLFVLSLSNTFLKLLPMLIYGSLSITLTIYFQTFPCWFFIFDTLFLWFPDSVKQSPHTSSYTSIIVTPLLSALHILFLNIILKKGFVV